MEELNGLVRDLDASDYFSRHGLSNSTIGNILKGENHFLERIINPPWTTQEMKFGTMLHDIFLTPDMFYNRYKVIPKFDMRTKKGKEGYQEFFDDNPNTDYFLNEIDLLMLSNMEKKLKENDLVKSIFDLCEKEVSMFTRCKETGIHQKGRADLISVDECLLADLKTTLDASPKAFLRSIMNYGYDRQAAYYCDLASSITGKKFETFIFIAIEKRPPYEIGIYSIDTKFFQRGRALYKQGMAKFKNLLQLNNNSYDFSQFNHRFKNETVELLECPSWALKGVI